MSHPTSHLRNTRARTATGALVLALAAGLAVPLSNASAAPDDTAGASTPSGSANVESSIAPSARSPFVAAGGDVDALTDLVLGRALRGSGATGRSADPSVRLATLREEGREVTVRVDRAKGAWVEGVAYVEAAADEHGAPQGWLFVARRTAGSWDLALEGEPGFLGAMGRAGTTTSSERATYVQAAKATRATSRTGAVRAAAAVSNDTGMQFPVKAGSWFQMGSPHGWSGSTGALSSVDISGSDGTVRAARAGTVRSLCNGWTRIIHDNGYSSDYYHLTAVRVTGGTVGKNAVLGNQGTSLCAGGAAYGAHVHFGLRQYDANLNGWYVSLDNKIIGSHRIRTGGYYTGGTTTDVVNGNYGVLPGQRWNR